MVPPQDPEPHQGPKALAQTRGTPKPQVSGPFGSKNPLKAGDEVESDWQKQAIGGAASGTTEAIWIDLVAWSLLEHVFYVVLDIWNRRLRPGSASGDRGNVILTLTPEPFFPGKMRVQ